MNFKFETSQSLRAEMFYNLFYTLSINIILYFITSGEALRIKKFDQHDIHMEVTEVR